MAGRSTAGAIRVPVDEKLFVNSGDPCPVRSCTEQLHGKQNEEAGILYQVPSPEPFRLSSQTEQPPVGPFLSCAAIQNSRCFGLGQRHSCRLRRSASSGTVRRDLY